MRLMSFWPYCLNFYQLRGLEQRVLSRLLPLGSLRWHLPRIILVNSIGAARVKINQNFPPVNLVKLAHNFIHYRTNLYLLMS